ncbi:MAG: PIN domain-containing protein [Candidatus Omnitrophica bacterium]|nr:PIN domain-containing protein [Candidatus Omnitrophota bacterium]
MILIDTSVLIDYLKGNQTETSNRLQYALDLKIPIGITSFIFQEVLQGVRTPQQFELLKKYLNTFPIYDPKSSRESYAQAAQIYFLCRKKGFTINSSVDCLVAQIACEHNLKLLHNDQDYFFIKKIIPDLEFF